MDLEGLQRLLQFRVQHGAETDGRRWRSARTV